LNEGPKVTVVGAGRGGIAMAADLTLADFNVRLYQHPKFEDSIRLLREAGGISISGVARTGFATPTLITTDAAGALDNADVIMMVAPALAHESLVQSISPHLTDGQIVVFNTGYFGALRFRALMQQTGKRLILAETSTLIYLCRTLGPNKVHVDKVKDNVSFAAMPASENKKAWKLVHKLYPQLVPVTNVLQTSFENMNLIHPPLVAMNIGLIEKAEKELFLYRDCLTPTLGEIIEKIDEERREVAEAFGVKIVSMLDFEEKSYGAKGSNIYEAVKRSSAHMNFSLSPARAFLDTILEDTPYLLVPIASFGKLVNVRTPLTSALVDLTSAIMRRNFWEEGATLKNLSLLGLSREEIVRLVS